MYIILYIIAIIIMQLYISTWIRKEKNSEKYKLKKASSGTE